MRFNSYRNTQRTEAKIIANMKERYGENFVVVMGDWSDAGRTAKFQTSSKTKGWRSLFRKNPCFLIDEFRTSSYCSLCEEKVEGKLWKRPSSRPWRRKEGHQEDVHGLLGELILGVLYLQALTIFSPGCTNPECFEQPKWTYRFWNRDLLSTCNMIKIVRSLLLGYGRPSLFCRGSDV